MLARIITGAVIGGVAGYGYYKLVGCSTGACPITSNPITSILYGAILGVLIATSIHPSH